MGLHSGLFPLKFRIHWMNLKRKSSKKLPPSSDLRIPASKDAMAKVLTPSDHQQWIVSKEAQLQGQDRAAFYTFVSGPCIHWCQNSGAPQERASLME